MLDKERVAHLKSKNLTVFEEVYSLRLEVYSGCNLNCWSCGRGRTNHGTMDFFTFEKILSDLTDRCTRMEFGVQGEPSLHPGLVDFVAMARKRLPKAQLLIISNTEAFRNDGHYTVKSLFDAGLNFLHADIYNERQMEWISKLNIEGVSIQDYYKQNVNAFSYKGNAQKTMIITNEIEGFGATRSATRVPHNFGGNLPYMHWQKLIGMQIKDFPLEKTCVEPLKYMTVNWNGDVNLCCREGAKAVVVGNTNNENLQDIWQGEAMQKIRLLLCNKKRKDIIPCVLCNARSFRSGLYPYWGPSYGYEDIIKDIDKYFSLNKKEHMHENLLSLLSIKELPIHITNYLRRKDECS